MSDEHGDLIAKVKSFLDKNYPCCGVDDCCGEIEEADEIVRIVTESGYRKMGVAG